MPSLPLGVNLSNVHVLTTLLNCVFFPSGRKKSLGISHILVECFLMSGSGGKLNKSIETLLFVQEEGARANGRDSEAGSSVVTGL